MDSSQLKASEFFPNPENEGEVEVKPVAGIDMDNAGESSPAMASLLPRTISAESKQKFRWRQKKANLNALDWAKGKLSPNKLDSMTV